MSDIPSKTKSQPPTVIEAVERGCAVASDGYLSPTSREFAQAVLDELKAAGYIIVRRATIAPTGGEKP